MRPIFAVAVVVLTAVGGACWSEEGFIDDGSSGCSNIGCQDRLEVEISRRDGEAFPAGDYLFDFTPAGGDTIQATCSLSNNSELDCAGEGSSLEMSVKGSMSAFEARFDFAPQSIDIRVYCGEQNLGEHAVSPDYHLLTPNGPDCDPICFQATVSVEVSAPAGT